MIFIYLFLQTREVNVYRFITEHTVEERLIARAEKKVRGIPIDHAVGLFLEARCIA
jgi:hypothetical protein